MNSQDRLEQLRLDLAAFAAARNWEHFHTPKNLSMALIVEAAELVEHFQWATPEESQHPDSDKLEEIRMELADIFIYLIRIADMLKLDLLQAATEKMAINQQRFPPTAS
ncbi:MAG: nucleotide pyrophosphohydrolase [Gammaproteobacteria bacterium]|nr:nucleotide pyrophosphohydrolase [Gammaproteobacteria bacterium]